MAALGPLQPLAVKAVTLTEIKRFLQNHREWQSELAIKGKKQSAWHAALNFVVAVLLKSCDPEVGVLACQLFACRFA